MNINTMGEINKILLLEKEIEQEIRRLEQTSYPNLEKEQARFRIYEALTKEILESQEFSKNSGKFKETFHV